MKLSGIWSSKINLTRAVFRQWVLLLLAFLCAPIVKAVEATEIGPDGDFCRTINDPASGEEIILLPGDYHGPCMIRRGGTAERPLVVRGKSAEARPRLVYEGPSANVLEVRADHVVVMGLAFGPTRNSVDGIRIRTNRDVSVIGCKFIDMGGIAVVANQTNLRGLRVRGNNISSSKATAMYFGCHDGQSCRLADVIIENNRIYGVAAVDNEVGYGIQVKLNSPSIIRDNVITDTKGPGIMIYGGREVFEESLIERNFVSGSRTSSGIVIGGGPAIVRNNISVANAHAGITLHDYGQWGLLRSIKVGFNTVYGNEAVGIGTPAGKIADSLVVGNVGWSVSGVPVFPSRQSGLRIEENLVCNKNCFVSADNGDFSPARYSVLDTRGVSFKASWIPEDDFFAQLRKGPPKIGAVEGVGKANVPKLNP